MVSITSIAVDGPVASGKTTVGRLVALKLGYRFLDTGSMYRAVTWTALEAGVSTKDNAGLVKLAQEHAMEVAFRPDGNTSILVDDRDITPCLRYQQVDQEVSHVSMVAGVREVLVSHQRRIAREGPIVMVGRDIGTVVLPEAPLKVFLVASTAERARRRHAEFETLGNAVPYQQVLDGLEQRDMLDSEREVGPLRPATDAHEIRTDGLSVEEVVESILGLVKRL